ncbi:MAG: MopE-related protein [Polyangiales bacterium]
MRRVATWLALAAGVVALGACSFSKSDHPDACRVDKDCKQGFSCVLGFCVQSKTSSPDSGAGSSSASDGGGNGNGQTVTGQGGTKCVDGQPPETCYDGPAGTVDVGLCKAGQRACVGGIFTQCLGQVLPADETCNGKDDNCDGTVDEIPMADCQTQMPGLCDTGLLTCRGTYAICEPASPPVDEVCNGKDDDCDGKTDEVAGTPCYPAGAAGCTVAKDGSVTCAGLCHPGLSGCAGGMQACSNAVTPAAEVCTTGGATAADENCDGNIDEGCACNNGQERPCYAGPKGTEGVGVCQAGTQRCQNKIWGACQSQVLPQPESCANSGADDDCNGVADDVPGLGNPCIDNAQKGICRDGTTRCQGGSLLPVCVTMQPQQELCDTIDQDCDGNPIDGFDLNADPQNCGACGNACGGHETCCGGSCLSQADLQTDVKNCGSCGAACGAGQYCCQAKCLNGPSGRPVIGGPDLLCMCSQDCGDKSCCGTQCVDMLNDVHNCGGCGNDCTAGGISVKLGCCKGVCSTVCVNG